MIAGQCEALAGATIFVIVRDLYRNLSDVDGLQQHWVQCGVKIKDTGEFLCGAFLCVDQATYEVLVVWPHTPEALRPYDDWLRQTSYLGKTQLPFLDNISLIGTNHTVIANHRLAPTPAACRVLESETDK